MNKTHQSIKQMIVNNGNKWVGIEFVKKDGTIRKITGHYRPVPGHEGQNPASHVEKYVTMVLSQKDEKGNVQFRNVNVETIKALHIEGKRIYFEG